MAFRFIHAADIHLDSPLRSLALRDPALSDLVRVATRAAFTRIVDLCLSEAVDALLIAGDLYDGEQTSMKTARFLARELGRLDAAGIATFVIRGNHDALSRITRELTLPPSVTVFGRKAEVRVLERPGRPVAIHGVSFEHPQAPDSLLGRFKAPVAGAINIGMLHTSLGGAEGHDLYAPCSLAELQATGFDYWALGHVHVRAVHHGRPTVVMPGIPQGRDIGEAGPKSVTLATIHDDGRVAVEARPTALAQFERVAVAVDGAAAWEDLPALLAAAIRAARGAAVADDLVLRLTLTGASPLAWRLRRDLDLVREEAGLIAEGVGRVWIEAVQSEVRDPSGAVGGAGPLADLAAMVGDGPPPPAVLAEAQAAAEELLRAMPAELRDLLGADEAAQAAACAALLREGATDVLAVVEGRQAGGAA